MNRAAFILLAALLAGCEVENGPQPAPDQCLRADLFARCMAALPAGPQATKYNDWDEVVDACQNASYYQSLRKREAIKPECQP